MPEPGQSRRVTVRHGEALGWERMEPRHLLAGITFNSTTGEVSILGSNDGDIVWVTSPIATQIQIALINVQAMVLPASSVTSVRFEGYDGNDFFRIAVPVPASAWGHGGNDTLIGGPLADRLFGGTGNDSLTGGNGADLLAGNGGEDQLDGEWGNDQLFGGDGDDLIACGDGDDIAGGAAGRDTLTGGAGLDQIFGEDGDDSLDGGDGNDWLFGGDGSDSLSGGTGNDQVFAGNGNDTALGGGGDDRLHGESGDDQIRGGEGSDFLAGNDGNDLLWGEDGSDVLYGYAGDDILRGGNGTDYLYGGTGNDQIFGEADRDILFGEADQDTLWGDSGDDDLVGGPGNDILLGGTGNDRLYGEAGDDVMLGNNDNDQLFGGDGNDSLYGEHGLDYLNGEAGNDGLFGGLGGGDVLTGGPGSERFLFWPGDTVTDFSTDEARLEIANATGVWLESEVRMVDAGLKILHDHRGHARLLLDSLDNDPVRLVKYATLPGGAPSANSLTGSGPPGNLNYVRELRIADWDETVASANESIKYSVIHEIGHSWDSVQEIVNRRPGSGGIWTAFLALSGWRDTNPNSTAWTLSGDGQWWYLNTATFADSYSRNSPREDWSTIWEILFDPTKASVRATLQAKVDKVLELLAVI